MGTQTVHDPSMTATTSTHPDPPAAPSETTPFLNASPNAAADGPPPKLPLRLSPALLITPVASLYTLAASLPSTTVFDAIRKIVCRYWYLTNDPDKIPADGSIPSGLCSIPAVDQRYSTALSIVAIFESVASLLAYSFLSSIANKYGRKPAILTVITFSICADVSMLSIAVLPNILEAFALLLWLVSQSVAVPTVFAFLLNTYIVDLVPAELRTAALSKINGWSTLGTAISMTAGGAITTHFNDIAPVYIIAFTLQCTTFLYVCFLIPETLHWAQGAEDTHPQHDDIPSTRNFMIRALLQCRHAIAAAILPLKALRPTRNFVTGKLNLRLLYCAVNVFIVGIGEGYMTPALMVWLTTRYDYTPQETGYTLSALIITNVVILTFVIPMLVRHVLRPLYVRATHLSTASDSESVSEVTDEMDVHIVIGSSLIQVASLLLFAAATRQASQLAAVILFGFSAGRGPVLRSLVVSTVPPELHSQALAAIEMCLGFGMLLSPVIVGSVMTATISTVPQAVFYLMAGIFGVSNLVLLFVRDSDRYHPTHND